MTWGEYRVTLYGKIQILVASSKTWGMKDFPETRDYDYSVHPKAEYSTWHFKAGKLI